MSRLFALGFGYSARALAARLRAKGWIVEGTVRSEDHAAELARQGFDAFVHDGTSRSAAVVQALGKATHLLLCAPPGPDGDPLLVHHAADVEAAARLAWIGYLSTVGVYGNHDGAWISEDAALNATRKRGLRRAGAERAWLAFGEAAGKAVHVFRLAGIYGPGRSAIDKLRSGRARRIVKPGQVFNRIHVEDIAGALEASIAKPNPGAVYNVCDDEPAPPQDVVSYGARLIGMPPPPEVPFEEAGMSDMARSFYGENKRVSNARIKSELGLTLAYPTYREGLRALAQEASGVEPADATPRA